MATPNETQAKQQISDAVKIWEEHRKYVGVTATPYLTREQTVLQELKSQFGESVTAALAMARMDLNSFMLRLPAVLDPLMRDYGQVMNVPETQGGLIFLRLYQYYIDNTFKVQSRMINYGSVTTVTAVGTGVINRLVQDENGYPLEATTPDTKTLRCLFDEHSGGTKHEEQFEVRGQAAEKDFLKVTGSNVFTAVRGISGRDTLQILSNPSFDNFGTSASAPSPITDWTVTGSLGNFEIDQSNYYRDYEGVTTPGALRIKTNDTIKQDITIRRAQFIPGVPYYMQVAWNRQVYAGDGTLTFTVGNVSVNVVAAAQTGWQILRIPIGANNWFKTFNKGTFTVEIQLSGNTTGDILVDDIIIAPFQFVDGLWLAPVGGSTKWLRYDKYTYADALYGSDAVLQQWIGWRTYGGSLPSAIQASLLAATAALAGLGAGNVNNGNHAWYVTFTGANGVGESAVSAKSNVLNVVNNAANGQVALTNVPLGPTGTTARKIYRTVAGDTGNPKLVGTIADNVTTTFNDNVADGSLGADAPAGVTWLDPT